jgi:PAS domain S-box-containing protein
LRAVLDTAAEAIVVTDENGTIISFNRAAEVIFGYTASEVMGSNLTKIVGADLAAEHMASPALALDSSDDQPTGGGCEIEGLHKNGATVPLDLSVAEWRDDGGQRFLTVIMRDISVRKAAEARQETLMRELDHRAKNILAVVQSVLRLTPQDRPGAFAAAETRVAGLARAHSLLAEGGWMGADLRAVAERELAHFVQTSSGLDRRAVGFNGPPLALAPSAVQPVAMVLHELATNAAKHGALSTPGGRVEVRWSAGRRKGEDGFLHLRWAEVGGPPIVGPPDRRGFGTRVIESTVRGQLGGSLEQRWESRGVVVEIAVPLTRLVAGDEAAERPSGNGARASAA